MHVIMKAEPGARVRNLRASLAAGTITLADARKRVHVFITTEKRPSKASGLISWGMRIATIARHRWRIETGFRVSDSISQSSHAHSNKAQDILGRYEPDERRPLEGPASTASEVKGRPEVVARGQTRDRFADVATDIMVKSHAAFLAAKV